MATVEEDVDLDNNATANDEDEEYDMDRTSKDRYGFFVSDKYHRCSNISMDLSTSRKVVELRRSQKWIRMMHKWQKYSEGSKSGKMKSRVRKGIPDDIRGYAWYHFARTDAIEKKYPDPHRIDTNVLSELVKDEVCYTFLFIFIHLSDVPNSFLLFLFIRLNAILIAPSQDMSFSIKAMG
jgi:hypothetical protein